MLERRTCFASSITCAIRAIPTANEFCLSWGPVCRLVSRTGSGADANQITSLSCVADCYKSDPLHDGVLLCSACRTSTAECKMLEGRACFAPSSTCAIGATQTANDFCLGCAALSSLVIRTCSGADAKHLTGRN